MSELGRRHHTEALGAETVRLVEPSDKSEAGESLGDNYLDSRRQRVVDTVAMPYIVEGELGQFLGPRSREHREQRQPSPRRPTAGPWVACIHPARENRLVYPLIFA